MTAGSSFARYLRIQTTQLASGFFTSQFILPEIKNSLLSDFHIGKNAKEQNPVVRTMRFENEEVKRDQMSNFETRILLLDQKNVYFLN